MFTPELDSEHGTAIMLMLAAHGFPDKRIALLFDVADDDVSKTLQCRSTHAHEVPSAPAKRATAADDIYDF